ncbi:helicase associated domain-containing protein [Pelagophyceae sp. CCMP2097]|nr:helicase associated domain-containing protein [Pelagophyceae sp. CCMP2097]
MRLPGPGWERQYLRLAAFRKAEGHCVVPSAFAAADGTKLAPWVQAQRRAHKAGRLNAERVERLEAIGFAWSVYSILDDDWDVHFEALRAHRDAKGTCAVPGRFVAADGTRLGWWVDLLRRARAAGDFLSAERIEQLDAAGFVWDIAAHSWDAKFEALRAFHATHGDCAMPFRFVAADGTKLGRWVWQQRQARKDGLLSPERIDRLEALGIVWAVPRNPWETHFELLTAYHAAHGDCVVPRTFVAAADTNLWHWVREQRRAYKGGEMSQGRIQRLEAVPFEWTLPSLVGWDAHFDLLLAYHAAHGDCVVPHDFVAADGTNLVHWLREQRLRYKAGELRKDRVKRLDEVGFVWRINQPALPGQELQ